MVKINIYVDGFNFYYGCLQNTPFKWLDFYSLSRKLFPKSDINRIRYFTALVKPTSNDPQKQTRQLKYIRALETIPVLSIHYGHFLSHPREMPLEKPLPGGPKSACVIRTEEKGSDVNLATYILVDAYESNFEQAVVISNDSDLAEPIRIINERLKLPVGVINPQIVSENPLFAGVNRGNPSYELKKAASFHWRIKPNQIINSQFPDVMTDKNGTFRKPGEW